MKLIFNIKGVIFKSDWTEGWQEEVTFQSELTLWIG
jgi:hypothetical protein